MGLDMEPLAAADMLDMLDMLDTSDTLDLVDTPDMLEIWDTPDSAVTSLARGLPMPTLTPTPSARSLSAFPRPTPMPPAIPTTPDMLVASAMATMADMEDTLETSDMPDMGSDTPDTDMDMLDMDMLVLWDTVMESKYQQQMPLHVNVIKFECDICNSLIFSSIKIEHFQ